MIWLAALAAAAAPSGQTPNSLATPAVQARATVRIVSGVRLSFQAQSVSDGPKLRQTVVRLGDGVSQARLYEFE
jgi:hypothetical protein